MSKCKCSTPEDNLYGVCQACYKDLDVEENLWKIDVPKVEFEHSEQPCVLPTCGTGLYYKEGNIVSMLTDRLNEGQMQDYELHEETVAEALKHLESKGFKISTPSPEEQLKNANEIIALLDAKLTVAKEGLRWYAVNTLVPLTQTELDSEEDREAYNQYLSGHVAEQALQDIVDLGRWETDDE